MECLLADHRRSAKIEIQYRHKRQIDTTVTQLAGQHRPQRSRRLIGADNIAAPVLAEHAHRRQMCKTVVAKTLYTPIFMIDCDQYFGPCCMNCRVNAVNYTRS